MSALLFISALFIAAKIWKHPECPLLDEWIKAMWCIYATGHYSALQEGGPAIYNSVDECGGSLAKENSLTES
jgi:hypothetical protein